MTAAVLRDESFRRLWTGMTVSRMGTSVAGIAVPLLAVDVLEASAFMVSLLTASVWLPWLLIGLPAGAWIDRMRKRPVLLTCDVVSTLLIASVPAAAWLVELTIGHLLVVTLLAGVAAVFFQVAWTAYIPAMFEADDLVGANAVLQGSDSAVQIVGRATGGVLLAAVGAVAGLIIDAVSFLVSFVALASIRRPERPVPPAPPRPLRSDVADGIRWLAGSPLLRSLTLHGAAGNLALTGYGAIIVVFLVRDLGVSTAMVGILMAVSGFGGVLAATVTPRLVRRFGAARTMIRSKIGAGFASLLIPLSTPELGLALFVLGWGLVAVCLVIGNVIAGTFRQSYVPAALLGRVVTGMQFVNYGAIPLGALLGGVAATLVGARGAIWMMTVFYAVAGLILVLGPWRGRRDLPDPAGSAAPVTT